MSACMSSGHSGAPDLSGAHSVASQKDASSPDARTSAAFEKRIKALGDLRREIARIEDKPASWFEAPHEEPASSTDQSCSASARSREAQTDQANQADQGESAETVSLGEDAVDQALGGGFPASGLCELHGDEVRDAGCLAGFVAALASRFGASAQHPAVWITARSALHEAGRPYPSGLKAFAPEAGALTLVSAQKLEDAIWAAEEAASCKALSLVILEVTGNPRQLGLEGTRRLHFRARKTGVPLVLMRQSAAAEATAAPLRLRIRPGPARPVAGLADQPRLIGAPVFCLAVEKNRFAPPCRLDLVWNSHDRSFFKSAKTDGESLSRADDAQASDRSDHARPAGAPMAFRRAG